MRVLIVDPEPTPLLKLCDDNSEIEVVGSATSGAAAIRAAANVGPDLLVLEVRLADMTGFDVLRAIEGADLPLARSNPT